VVHYKVSEGFSKKVSEDPMRWYIISFSKNYQKKAKKLKKVRRTQSFFKLYNFGPNV
jgi:hypothetical protein